jgi:chemotaxis protein CheY-P-specific phosphatase CheC
MLKTIVEASENFCIHQIAEAHEVNDEISKKRTLIAYIDIETKEDKKFRVYIGSESGFAQRVAKLFLEEDESDEETLIDMLLETVNLIVGSAKVIAQKNSNEEFSITTPHFIKIDTFDLDYDEIKSIRIEDDEMIIAIKEING